MAWRGFKRHIGCGQQVKLQIGKFTALDGAVAGFAAVAGDDAAQALGGHVAAQVFVGVFGRNRWYKNSSHWLCRQRSLTPTNLSL